MKDAARSWTLLVHVALIATVAPSAAAEFDAAGEFAGTYLCLPTASGGVSYDATSKTWVGVRFRLRDQLIVILNPTKVGRQQGILDEQDAIGYEIDIVPVGSKDRRRCRKDLSLPDDDIFIRFGVAKCDYLLNDFKINLSTGRFMMIYPIGFLDGQDNYENTPSITVGTCTKIQ